ncbi:methyl-accepting chemotaxis protein [Clostridium cibarium]|uniref:Methyl-accepting chemotaxis protein n=1 Tax=Clostridium cibarium TaxID=2762247 RepID=A0ABR8PUY1_9CLOT|nr:methyl-accepting chemotaxis protein [Clostridium cibarium]MBD7911947.1 methyl-accepting chemotaxis protein [Clostridium cibarium]
MRLDRIKLIKTKSTSEKVNNKNAEKFKLNSIRTKLVVSLVAICVIPLIISGYNSYSKSKSILNEKLKVTSVQTLSEVNNGITDYFNGFINMISATANNYNIINSDNINNDKYIDDILKNVKESNVDINSVFLANEDGKYKIYPNENLPDDFVATERPWYKEASARKGQTVVTLPFKDAQKNIYVVSVARAVIRDNKVVGVLSMSISLTSFSDKIAAKAVGSTGYIYISDIDGKSMIAHPNKELIGTEEASKLTIWNTVKSNKNGFLEYNFNGAKKFGAYETNNITGWKLVASMNEKELTNDTNPILYNTLMISLVMGVIALILSFILSKGIAHNIKNLKEVFAKASEGDLTVSIKATTKDEFKDLADSFNYMINNISSLMKSVTESSKEVLETSSNLASMSEEVNASVEEVAKAIEEVSAGATNQSQSAQNGAEKMNELSYGLDKVSVGSNEVDRLSTNTKELSAKGLSMIDTLIDKSNKTKVATKEVNDIVQDMNESTKKINTISETISQITEQTNLLSLNASIESARAGEAGKGFAVVAEEIRKLAEQSKSSTEEIKLIIANIQQKSDTAVNAIRSTEEVVNEQDAAVGETKLIFSDILSSIGTMINKVEEIKSSISEIDTKKKVVLEEIEDISSVSQETASASEEVTASTEEISSAMNNFTSYAEELRDLAENLENMILKFKID